jgi:hypothetical protein
VSMREYSCRSVWLHIVVWIFKDLLETRTVLRFQQDVVRQVQLRFWKRVATVREQAGAIKTRTPKHEEVGGALTTHLLSCRMAALGLDKKCK